MPNASPATQNLTPSLNQAQLQQNIDALQKGGMATSDVQAYVNNYKSDGQGGYVLANAPASPSTAPASTTTPAAPIVGGAAASFMSAMNNDTNARAQNVATDIEQPAKVATAGGSPLAVAKSVGEAGLNTAGEAAGSIGDFISEGVKAITPQPVLDALTSVASKIGGSAPVQAIAQKWNDFATANPQAAKDLGSVFNIGTLVAGGEGADARRASSHKVSH